MRERVISFGEGGRLSGVTLQVPGDVAVLLFNAGIVHRIGAHRLNVKIARALAAEGVSSLRFDLSGLGDSAPGPASQGFEDQAVDDICAAIDQIQEKKRIYAIGMCSGADNAYRAAAADERLSGAILLDPYAYQHSQVKLRDLASKALDVDGWRRRLSRLAASDPEPGSSADESRSSRSRQEFGRELEKITGRGGEILILYTTYVAAQLTRPEHFHDLFREFDFAGRLTVEVNMTVDHTYTELAAQVALIARIARWIREGGR